MAGNDVVILVKEPENIVAEFVKPADASVTEEGSSSRSSISTVQELKSKFQELEEARNPKQKAKPQFPRVVKMLGAELRGSDDNYEPKLISLGPYHHGKGHLVKGETLKLKLAATYMDMCGKTVDDFYGKINASIQKLKGCYDPEVTKEYSNEEFSVMMLVDGCFLLFYMFCVCTGWFKEDCNIRYQDLSRLNQDALLLENQLPLELLLKKLMEQLDSSCDLWMEMCHAFIRLNNRESFQKENNYNFRLCFPINQIANQRPQRSWKPDEEFNSCHLLHLFRRNILGNEGSSQTYTEDQCLKEDGKLKPQNVQEAMTVDFLSFRNVKELMAARIRIKRSPTCYLRDISVT